MNILTLISIGLASFNMLNAEEAAITESNEAKLRTVNHNSFQIGEKLNYRLHYGVVDAATATLEVKSTGRTIKGRELFHVVGTGTSISAFNWFFKVRDRYESYIDKDGVFPWVFIRRVNEGGYKIEQDYTFYQHKNSVNTGKKTHAVPDNIQDMISAFYYARTLDFSKAKVGDVFTINTFVDGEVFPLKIKYKGKETIKIKSGKYKCMKFAPVVQKGRIFKKEEDLAVWISDDKNKIPVLAKAKILFGSIKMELSGYEGLASPIAKEIKKK